MEERNSSPSPDSCEGNIPSTVISPYIPHPSVDSDKRSTILFVGNSDSASFGSDDEQNCQATIHNFSATDTLIVDGDKETPISIYESLDNDIEGGKRSHVPTVECDSAGSAAKLTSSSNLSVRKESTGGNADGGSPEANRRKKKRQHSSRQNSSQ